MNHFLKQLGDTITLAVVTKVGTHGGAASVPTGQVTAKIYKGDGSLKETVTLAVRDKPNSTGLFWKRHLLGNIQTGAYIADDYFIIYSWLISAKTYTQIETFEIVAGGDVKGSVVAMEGVQHPDKTGVIFQDEDSNVQYGRNPT